MKVTAVTVTYGDRFTYLKQVIESVIKEGVDKVVIVSNGSTKSSLDQLKKFIINFDCIQLIELSNNTGSANGFYQGLKAAYDSPTDFIWILDDDNKAKKNSLLELKKFWTENSNSLPKNNSALLSYRSDRELYKQAVEFNDPYKMLGVKNSFLGFDFIEKIKKRVLTKPNELKSNFTEKEGVVAVAPYGGLFFHKMLIDKIGLPNRSYYLYGDDYDFSYRITKNNGNIYLVLSSELEDLEKSFHLKHVKAKHLTNRFMKTESKVKIFYAVRNGIKFEQNFVNSKLLYFINSLLYTFFTFVILFLNFKHFWKFKYYLKGVIASTK